MMKTNGKASKALALCLALLLMIGLFGTTAFAIGQDDTGIITVSGVEDGVTVSAYRLMDVNINANGQPQEPVYTWTNKVAGWVRANYSTYIGTGADNSVQSVFSSASADAIATFYDALAAAIKSNAIADFTATATETAAEGGATLSSLAMGNYLILIENGYKVYRPSAVNLVPEWDEDRWVMTSPAEVEVKSSDMTITKTVKAAGTADGKKADNASIGDTVTFDIVADVPQFPANALEKNYAISDILPNGLALTANSIIVYGVNGEEETALTNNGTVYYNQGTVRPNNGGTSAFTLTFVYDTISSFEKIHITYTATLTADAVLGEDGNVNNAYLDYSNNPYVEDSWIPKDDSATVYTYGLDISKVDKDNHETFLAGAEFELYASQDDATNGVNKIAFIRESEGVYRKALAGETGVVTTLVIGSGQNGSTLGKLILKGLDEADWYLKETKAPDGYNLLAAPVKVTITDAKEGVLDGKVTDSDIVTGLVPLAVENDDGFRLPVTGGMGTILFTAVGVVLMGAAVFLLIVGFKKKKSVN